MSIKYVPVRALRATADFDFQRYFFEMTPNIELADLFKPITWSHHAALLRKHDVIRVVSMDGSIDVDLTVRAVESGGVQMGVRPILGNKSGEAAIEAAHVVAASSTPTTVPLDKEGKPVVRVEYLNATKWRVIGIGNMQVSGNHETEAAARKAMLKYLKDNKLTMPEAGTSKDKDAA